MLEQQISRNQVLEEKLNATLEKEKKERVNLKRFINEDGVFGRVAGKSAAEFVKNR